jgi:hypothetical protein
MNAESTPSSKATQVRAPFVLALALALAALAVTLALLLATQRAENRRLARQLDNHQAAETRQLNATLAESLNRVDASLTQAQSTLARLVELERERQSATERLAKEQAARAQAEREREEARQKAAARAAQNTISTEQLVTLAALRAIESAGTRAQAAPPVIVVQPSQPPPVYWTYPVVWWPRHHFHHHHTNFQPALSTPGSSQAMIPPGSSFRFIQTENYDPFANGRRL